MSGDEVLALVLSLMLAGVAWGKSIYETLRIRSCPSSTPLLLLTPLAVPLVSACILYYVLRHYASHDVRDSTVYTTFYMIMGAGWVGAVLWIWQLLGITLRDDLLERGNAAAACAIAGAMVALTFCFAGGNVGDGPGWWVVVFAAVLSTGTLLVLWCVLERVSRLGEAITVDRDAASGLRAAGYLIGFGAILGRAVAGNWVSAGATIADFAVLGWPALVVLVVAVILEKALGPNARAPQRSALVFGLPVFLAVLAASAWYLKVKS